jgi:hypothetical protein
VKLHLRINLGEEKKKHLGVLDGSFCSPYMCSPCHSNHSLANIGFAHHAREFLLWNVDFKVSLINGLFN